MPVVRVARERDRALPAPNSWLDYAGVVGCGCSRATSREPATELPVVRVVAPPRSAVPLPWIVVVVGAFLLVVVVGSLVT